MPCYLPEQGNRLICFSRRLITAWQPLPVCLLLLCCFSLLLFFVSSSRPQPREDLYHCWYLLFLLPSSISGLFPPPAEATSCQQFGLVVEAQRQKLDSLLCPESPHIFFSTTVSPSEGSNTDIRLSSICFISRLIRATKPSENTVILAVVPQK